jgi:hypothetical protein
MAPYPSVHIVISFSDFSTSDEEDGRTKPHGTKHSTVSTRSGLAFNSVEEEDIHGLV